VNGSELFPQQQVLEDGMYARMAGVALALVSFSSATGAQVFTVGGSDASRDAGPRRSSGYFGAAVTYASPQDEFRNNVKQGFGFDINAHYKLDRQGILSIGGELGYIGYGRETNRVPLSTTIGGRILVDVTTSNNIFWLGLGPQLIAPSGPVRPYVNATAGFAAFWTESSVEGSQDEDDFAKTTNYNDATFAWTGGAGIVIPMGRTRTTGLDIGLRYHGNGNVQYLRRGDVIDLPNGDVELRVNEGETPMLMWRVGFKWGF